MSSSGNPFLPVSPPSVTSTATHTSMDPFSQNATSASVFGSTTNAPNGSPFFGGIPVGGVQWNNMGTAGMPGTTAGAVGGMGSPSLYASPTFMRVGNAEPLPFAQGGNDNHLPFAQGGEVIGNPGMTAGRGGPVQLNQGNRGNLLD